MLLAHLALVALAADAGGDPCTNDSQCYGKICFEGQCQYPKMCNEKTPCPAQQFCEMHFFDGWCRICPRESDGPLQSEVVFEGLRYRLAARQVKTADGKAYAPELDVTVEPADGKPHGVHVASAFTHGSHSRHGWGTLTPNHPPDGVPDTCLQPGQQAKLEYRLRPSDQAEVYKTQRLELGAGVLVGDCKALDASVSFANVVIDYSCAKPSLFLDTTTRKGPPPPLAPPDAGVLQSCDTIAADGQCIDSLEADGLRGLCPKGYLPAKASVLAAKACPAADVVASCQIAGRAVFAHYYSKGGRKQTPASAAKDCQRIKGKIVGQ